MNDVIVLNLKLPHLKNVPKLLKVLPTLTYSTLYISFPQYISKIRVKMLSVNISY